MEHHLSKQHIDEFDIAVIGMECRFPGANNISEYWMNLKNGVESIIQLNDEELKESNVSEETIRQLNYIKFASIIDNADKFDAHFFGYSPKEAAMMDPQHRLFLELAWHALENAGYDSEQYNGNIGIFAGANFNFYLINNILKGRNILNNSDIFFMQIANDKDNLTTRVAYKLNLKGPAVTLQTACSTSLVAIHYACQGLLNHECDIALAGGITVRSPQKVGYFYQPEMILSKDGHCRPFDADASGTIFGNGGGIVVLKRLEDAVRDNDLIHAIVKGTAVNNDGSDKIDYTAPGRKGQEAVLANAIAIAGIPKETITAIEAHGTGTILGDPIEFESLQKVYGSYNHLNDKIALGSVKSNLGHLECAAGVASFIKMVLSLKHKTLVPSFNFTKPNLHIDIKNSSFYVNTETKEWRIPEGMPRRCAVSSFGIGGTNAHIVLEEAVPRIEEKQVERPVELITLSAKTQEALDKMSKNLIRFLKQNNSMNISDLASTLRIGRRAFNFRCAVVARDIKSIIEVIENNDQEKIFTAYKKVNEPEVVFMFPGQGAQYVFMAREIYENEPVFREEVDRCAEIIKRHMEIDIRDLIFPENGRTEEASKQLSHTRNTQPAIFTIEYSLAKLWMSWGIQPDAMIGHSLGEYIAACLSGVFSLEDALFVVMKRSELINALPGGSMCGTMLSVEKLRPYLNEKLSIAAVNGPTLTVVSGHTDEIEKFTHILEKEGLPYRLLHISHAFHSLMMKPISAQFLSVVKEVKLNPPKIPYMSNFSGDWIMEKEATSPQYWVDQMLSTINFSSGISKLLKNERNIYLEVGPGTTLSTFVQDHDRKAFTISSLPHPKEQRCSLEYIINAVGRMWVHGVQPDWKKFQGNEIRNKVELPVYPFERKRYWINPFIDGQREESLETMKIDKYTECALDETAKSQCLEKKIKPRNHLEEEILQIFEHTLGESEISVEDNFFKLGGHSLLALQLLSKVSEKINVQIKLNDFFKNPTVAGLAEQIENLSHFASASVCGLPELNEDKENRFDPFPLTEMQQAQWLGRISSFNMGNVAAHIYVELEKDGLDLERLQNSWQAMIDRHEMLRTILLPEGTQKILKGRQIYKIQNLDLRDNDSETVEQEVLSVRGEMDHVVRPIDTWPLFEVRTTQLPDNRTRLHFSIDLLICDFGSFRILQSEWSRLYKDPNLKLPELNLSFRDYVMAEKKIKDTELYSQADKFWDNRVMELPITTVPELPMVKDSATIEKPHFKRWSFVIEKEKWERIKKYGIGQQIFPSSIILTAFAQILGNWSKNTEFCINTPIINRIPFHNQVKQIIGEFASFAPVLVKLSRGKTFEELAKELQQWSLENLEHRYVSGTSILRKLAQHRGGFFGAVLPVVFTSTIVHKVDGEEEFEKQFGEYVYAISQTPQVWLDHTAMENEKGLILSWHAIDEMFPSGLLDKMWNSYEKFMNLLGEDESTWKECYYNILPKDELELRKQVNNTYKDFSYELMQTPIIKQASRNPHWIALINNDREITYGQLVEWANGIGKALREDGVKRAELVAIVMEKGYEQIVSALGILQAGGAYLPLDPHLPKERLWFIMESSGVNIVLTQEKYAEEIEWPESVAVRVISDNTLNELGACSEEFDPIQSLDDLAYVIFTSGSTGKPKGVMINHRAAQNTIMDINNRFGINETDRGFVLSELNFDLSVYDIFGILAAGGSLVIPRPNSSRDPEHWLDLITKHHVTIWNSVPALMAMFIEYTEKKSVNIPLRLVLLSGDWIPLNLPARLKERIPNSEVISLGGATECSIWSIFYPIGEINSSWNSIPYGKPLSNQSFYVLNGDLVPCSIWVAGELYIGGKGLAMGYLNEPDLTAKSFIVHPDTKERLYRTGDFGRYLPDGNIEFLGREDFQVKISGFRVELEEIEVALIKHPAIKSAIVNALGKSREEKSRLVGYIILKENSKVEIEEIKAFLSDRLPDYMVPNEFIILDSFPLTPNGKVNKSALPEPEKGEMKSQECDKDTGILVKKLVSVFAEVIGKNESEIDINTNFFAMGGDSIMGIQIISRAEKKGIKISPQQFFEHPTILDLASVLKVDTTEMSGDQKRLSGIVPLSPTQHWVFENYDYFSSSINWSMLVKMNTPMKLNLLETTYQYLVNHYDSFQLHYISKQFGWEQSYQEDMVKPELDYVDISGMDEEEFMSLFQNIRYDLEKMQDLAESPLVKLCVFDNQSNGLQYLLLVSNQLIMDFRSIGLFFHDLHTVYQQIEDGIGTLLPRTVKRFKDWADKYKEEKLQCEAEICKDCILATFPEIALEVDLGQAGEQRDKKMDVIFVLEEGEETEKLNEAIGFARISVEELILIAMAKSLKKNGVSEAFHADCILPHTSDFLRQTDFDNVVGNLSTVFPLYLNICLKDELDDIIIRAKEEIRNFSGNEEHYGVLRYMTENKVVQEEMKRVPKPAIKFSYNDGSDKIHSIYKYKEVRRHSMQNYVKETFPYALEVDAFKINDGLQLHLSFDPSRGCYEVVQDFGAKILEEIKSIVDFILKGDKIFYVPGDFREADWDASEMGEFLEAFLNKGD